METSVNNKCRAFTSLEQSKKLAEILPIESADMGWNVFVDGTTRILPIDDWDLVKNGSNNVKFYHAWSLTALLGVLPSRLFDSTPKRKELYLLPDLDKSYCFYRQFAVKTKGKIYLLTEGECLVDACVAMIEKLNELNLL